MSVSHSRFGPSAVKSPRRSLNDHLAGEASHTVAPVWVNSATMVVCAPELFVEQFLPTYDVAVVHADVFRAPPAQCYARVMELDLLQAPIVRAALAVRALPQRVTGTVRAPGNGTAIDAPPPTFRLRDMVGLGWVLLAETPGVEMVLGQV